MGVIKKSHKRGSAIGRFFVYLILIAIGISMIFPLYWMIRGAFMETSLDVMDVTQFFPNKFDFGNFVEAFESAPFGQYLKNTLFLLVFNVTATVVSCSFVAFGFSRINFRYREKFFAIMLGCMMIPGTVMQIPQFVGWVNVGAFDTFMPLTIPSLFGSDASSPIVSGPTTLPSTTPPLRINALCFFANCDRTRRAAVSSGPKTSALGPVRMS